MDLCKYQIVSCNYFCTSNFQNWLKLGTQNMLYLSTYIQRPKYFLLTNYFQEHKHFLKATYVQNVTLICFLYHIIYNSTILHILCCNIFFVFTFQIVSNHDKFEPKQDENSNTLRIPRISVEQISIDSYSLYEEAFIQNYFKIEINL